MLLIFSPGENRMKASLVTVHLDWYMKIDSPVTAASLTYEALANL